MKLAEKDIERIRAYFQEKPVIKAFLFGSYVRNEANEDSDVDILVELDYSKHIGLGFVDMKSDLEVILRKKIDLVSTQAVSKNIMPFVEKDKMLIYERQVE